jgi:hypothetical protein
MRRSVTFQRTRLGLVDMQPPLPADAPIVALFSNRLRWFTTVGLQGGLALLFIFSPSTTMEWFRVPPSVELGIVYQLYGAILLNRAILEQYVRSARDPAWMRRYIVASFPFNLSLAYFMGYAAWCGLMNFWVGVVFSAMSVAEMIEFVVAMVRWSRAVQSSEISGE